MDPTTVSLHLEELSEACAGTETAASLARSALPILRALAEADAALVVRRTADGLDVLADDGTVPTDLSADVLAGAEAQAGHGHLADCVVDAHGVARVAAQELPGGLGTLVLAWRSADAHSDSLTLGCTLLDAALGRRVAEADLLDLTARMDNAQHLANMGDYDWHIPSDTNRWSDQLYRIYGHEPRSFNPSYDRFLSLIHPDDRDRISALHQNAYATGEPYQMIERILRPDGDVRYLSSNGEVLMDAGGTPVRMRGTCIDITEQVLAEQEREHIAARFRGLVESAPDAILVLDEGGRVREANRRAGELLGGDPVGHRIEQILTADVRRDATGVPAHGVDGRDLVLDATKVSVDRVEGESFVAVFLRDATPRLEGEALAARLGEAQLRRRQALEINDNVVQGLVAAAYALDQGQAQVSSSYLARTLGAARAMMDDLLDPLDGEGLRPGDLVRSSAASLDGAKEHRAADETPGTSATDTAEQLSEPPPVEHRVLVVDDSDDLRDLITMRLERQQDVLVVGEAKDGVEAVELAASLQPHLVLLDLAMPRMDGLEALPLIKQAVPGVRVIVLSGFNQSSLAERAMAAGADRYVVKGGPLSGLMHEVRSVLAPA